MALAKDPALLILDEPTTGLDATVEAEVLDLVANLQAEFDTSVLFISHNLGPHLEDVRHGRRALRRPARRGRARSTSSSRIRAIPTPSASSAASREAASARTRAGSTRSPGFMPSLGSEITGCVFADRCMLADDRCRQEEPPLESVGEAHAARCFYHARAHELPREEAAELALPAVDRIRAAAAPARRSGQGLPPARDGHPRPRRRQRLDLAGRDARARRRVRQRQDDAGPHRARDRRPELGLGRDGLAAARTPVPEAHARGPALAPDRLPEPGLGAQSAATRCGGSCSARCASWQGSGARRPRRG